ncbi:methionyl-tRNA formyltransferase, mitochondrial isoform X2 [Agrilus planipennis]|nr:methionyl-tRNA formyltransferase, mitochondrial isoform X2 [Agrilus planipennis]XP_025832218.1 methionyl-tRNA formyltransferase, mitochondrial isoform X2 [Agrilus planipennis]
MMAMMILRECKIITANKRFRTCRFFCYGSDLKPPWKILFFGNDSFSLYTLKMLSDDQKCKPLVKNLEVVTSVKMWSKDVVKQFALERNLKYHKWPLRSLKSGDFDFGIVVSFGKLIPESVINKFSLGILNVHASLLPRWRGAAPIIHAIANGDQMTGVTIMKIKPYHFDVGDILHQKEIPLERGINAIQLHNKLGHLGAEALAEVLNDLSRYVKSARPQPTENATYAPKVAPVMSYINWETMPSEKICNISSALVKVYDLVAVWNKQLIKLLDINEYGTPVNDDDFEIGGVQYNKNISKLLVKCQDGKWISVGGVKIAGSKVISATDFNNGYLKKQPKSMRKFTSYVDNLCKKS